MIKAVAINGSPRKDKGNTAFLLTPFIQGMTEGGSEVELYYTSRMKIKPCSCGMLNCWNSTPGECSIQDDMQNLYPVLKAADILILATPVYSPLPGDMQNFLNRLVPLMQPKLVRREGRTRAQAREGVMVKKIALVAVSGWWEIENLDTVLRIARELAEDISIEFAGGMLRPHSSYMRNNGETTKEGAAVLEAAKQAGYELATEGFMHPETLLTVSRPLISESAYWGA